MTFRHSGRGLAIVLGLLLFAALPASSQVITAHTDPPPCTGEHCLKQIPGATVPHHNAASATRAACPAGTVYDSRKGTCRVMPN